MAPEITEDLSTCSDHELIQRIASARDEDALQIVYERYGRNLYALALRFLGDESLAQDVLSGLFQPLGLRPREN